MQLLWKKKMNSQHSEFPAMSGPALKSGPGRRKEGLKRALNPNNNVMNTFFQSTQKAASRQADKANESQEANITANISIHGLG